MNNQWKGTNRPKYLLQFHLIFVCKYRKHLLARKERTFWTDGYFACSVGNVSEQMLKEYIENQG